MLIRHATDADLDPITTLIATTPGAEVNTVKPARFAEYLGLNSYRPEWMWVAEVAAGATNTPMAATFDRAGWHRFGIRLVLSRPV